MIAAMLYEIGEIGSLVCGSWSILVVALDVLLSAKQKQIIRDRFTSVWFWLSDRTPNIYLNFARKKYVFVALALIGIVMALARMFVLSGDEIAPSNLPIGILVFSCFTLYQSGYEFYIWALSGDSSPAILLKLLVIFVIFWVVAVLPGLLLFTFASVDQQQQTWFWVVSFIGQSALNALAPFIILLVPTMIVMTTLSIAVVIYKIIEIFTLRIAENEKGPVVALSVLLVAAGFILKKTLL